MNFLRKIRNRNEQGPNKSTQRATLAGGTERQFTAAANNATEDEQKFGSVQEAQSWVRQNRENITPLRYEPAYEEEKYPQPHLTEEQGSHLLSTFKTSKSGVRYSRILGQNIRLLALAPGRGLDVIHCRLKHASLQSAIYYEALSYAWGDPKPRFKIICDGATVFVTASLHRALWQFRELGVLGPLWIDAICINQADIQEKTEQVKMMRLVYEKASLVRIWLGQASKDTENAVLLLTRVYQAISAKSRDPDPAEAYISLTSMGLMNATPEDILMIWNFFGEWWFDRSWVVQELVAATTAVFQTGVFEIEADVLLTVAAALSKSLPHSYAMEASIPHSKVESIKPFRFPASVFSTVKQQYDTGRKPCLSELIRRTAQLKATEPHDKIFAFVGIAGDGNLSIIDYNVSVRDLHLSVAKNALLSSEAPQAEGLDFLSNIRTYMDTRDPVVHEPQMKKQLGIDSPLSDYSLPSWAPDLTHYDAFFEDSIVPLSTIFPSNAIELGSTREIRLLDNEILGIRGKIFDAADAFYESFPYRFPSRFTAHRITADTILEELAKWPVGCFAFVQQRGLFTDQGGSITQPTFARTLAFNSAFGDSSIQRSLDWLYFKSYMAWHAVLGLVAKGYRVNKVDKSLYEATADSINETFASAIQQAENKGESHAHVTPDIKAADVLSFASTFERFARGRKFGVSQRTKMIGWFPECTREGDVICLFNGSRMPCVLRYVEEKEAYKIVGDCALHLFMDEALFKMIETKIEGLEGGMIKIC